MKFRVGDKVKLIKQNDCIYGFRVGEIYKISEINKDSYHPITIMNEKIRGYVDAKEIELVERKFTKDDLQKGDKCTLKRGDVIYYNKGMYEPSYNFYNLNKELEYEANDEVSIVKVERPVKYETVFERKEEILDEVEKRYLANVIRPFKDKVSGIRKCSCNNTTSYIRLVIDDDTEMNFPDFETGTMYQGMKAGKEYTLEELKL